MSGIITDLYRNHCGTSTIRKNDPLVDREATYSGLCVVQIIEFCNDEPEKRTFLRIYHDLATQLGAGWILRIHNWRIKPLNATSASQQCLETNGKSRNKRYWWWFQSLNFKSTTSLSMNIWFLYIMEHPCCYSIGISVPSTDVKVARV